MNMSTSPKTIKYYSVCSGDEVSLSSDGISKHILEMVLPNFTPALTSCFTSTTYLSLLSLISSQVYWSEIFLERVKA